MKKRVFAAVEGSDAPGRAGANPASTRSKASKVGDLPRRQTVTELVGCVLLHLCARRSTPSAHVRPVLALALS
jgi:hypothetical protein